MTDEQIKDYLKDWVKDYCNNKFLVLNPDYDPDVADSQKYIEVLPAGVYLFIENAVKAYKQDVGIQSESLGDYSVTFKPDMLITLAKQYLQPYKKVKFV
jgi:hypothetical protein